jgi:hypothetical protein
MTQPPGYPGQPGQPDPYGNPGQPQQPPAPGAWPGYGQQPDPYTQQQPDPYSQQPDPYSQQPNPYGAPPPPPPDPYGAPPTSGQPYLQPGQLGQPDPYAPPTSGQPFAPPTSAQPYVQPGYAPNTGYIGAPGYPPPPPPKKKRGLMIVLLVVGLVVVLCGGGGAAAYFVFRDSGGTGQATPVDAVQGFLKAIYVDHDADAAANLTCSSSRDKNTLIKRIDDIKSYDTSLKDPSYTWPTPTVQKQDSTSATVNADVKVTTSDDKVAESKLTFVTTNNSGWFVCEISGA